MIVRMRDGWRTIMPSGQILKFISFLF